MVVACAMTMSNSNDHKENNSFTEKINVNEPIPTPPNNEISNKEQITTNNFLEISPSISQSTSGIDFIENEEVKVVICQDNSAAVTTTRRSQRNIGKKPRRYNIYSETDTSNDSFSSNSSTESPTKKKSLSAKNQVKIISPKRGPGRPRKNVDLTETQRTIGSPIIPRPNAQSNKPVGRPPIRPAKSLRLKFSLDSGTTSTSTTPEKKVSGNQTSVEVTPSAHFSNTSVSNTDTFTQRMSEKPIFNGNNSEIPIGTTSDVPVNVTPIKRGPGRPRKNPLPLDSMKSPVNGQSARQNDRKRKINVNSRNATLNESKNNDGNYSKETFVTPRTKRTKTLSNNEESLSEIISKKPEKPKTPLGIIREERVKERVDDLVQVVEEHDSLVRELYYMESYNMLMWDLDPQKINSDNSERMVKYLENHNLWSSLNEQVTNSIQSNSTRMSTRRSLNKHRDSILSMLQQSIGSRVFHNVMPSEHTSGDSDSGSRPFRRSSRVDSTSNRDNASSGSMSLYSLRRRGHAQFPSFEAYLESFITLDDEDITPAEEAARLPNEIDVDYRILVLKNKGKLQPIPKPASEPPRQKVHWDFILDGVVAKSKRINKSSDERLRKTHQVSRAILGHFNKLAMKEPNAIKAEEKRIKKLAKTTANLVKHRWREIAKFINDMHDKLVAEEEERRGKQKLNALFEDATQKIEFHEKYLMGTTTMEDVNINNNDKQEFKSDINLSDEDQMSMDEEVMEIESSDDDEEIRNLQAEKDLPLEDLMEKYDYPLYFEDQEDNRSTDPDMSDEEVEKDQSFQHGESDAYMNVDNEASSFPSISTPEQLDNALRKSLRKRTLSLDIKTVNLSDDPDINDREFTVSLDQCVEDNEASLEAQELEEDSEEEAIELNELADEMNLPIDELLKRYGVNKHSEEENNADIEESKLVSNGTTSKGLRKGVQEKRKSDVSSLYDSDDDSLSELDTSTQSSESSNVSVRIENIPANGGEMPRQHEADESISVVTTDTDDDFTTKFLISKSQESFMKKAIITSDNRSDNSKLSAKRKKLEKEPGRLEDGTDTSRQSTNITALTITKARTPIPSLLRGQLRAYQHDGLHWLASLYEQGSNGILADEMGLGKTIQTIALLAHLACDKGVWGPHLIIVPTSVIINWEMEFKKWCPGFIILTYYGSPKERKEKRLGWSKEHSFHVCITSYHLAVQDAINFRKKKWHYLILDEAHNIKNFKSQRWNTLLNFNSERRLLLTGTPLQNNLMELWSLLYFLKPNARNDDMSFEYANQKEFQDWFSRPVDKMIENNEGFDEKTRAAILTLHTLLRPYLLRRLKIDVEKQLPAKHTHIIKCRLSKRQRFLYDDFMSRSKTKETLRSGNFLSIINCLMQLRKVCNHPDLFEVRPIVTSFAMSRSAIRDYEYCELTLRNRLNRGNYHLERINLDLFNLITIDYENMDWLATSEYSVLDPDNLFEKKLYLCNSRINTNIEEISYYSLTKFGNIMQNHVHIATLERWNHMRYINSFRLKRRPIYGTGLINICRQLGTTSFEKFLMDSKNPRKNLECTTTLPDMVVSYERRYDMMEEVIKRYAFVTPAVVASDVCSYALAELPEEFRYIVHNQVRDLYYPIRVKLMIAFPDKRLLQYDCGKLQELDRLLRNLKEKGHRALIFTQMTRVLDILEIFLNIHGHRYLRLDGATKIEQRQLLTERFNNDPRILVFILSTRSGGLGINLTGADTVIFYDIDWNPCMDRQCQDRCHRIGQTREVNIFRFVCEATIEENMLAKAQQKEMLDKMVITDGGFTTDFWSQPKVDWRDIVKVIAPDHDKEINDEPESGIELEQCLAKVEDDTDVNAAQIAKKEMESDLIEFDENAITPTESSGVAENSGAAIVRRESTISTAPSPMNENFEVDDSLKSHLLPVELYMFRFMEYDLGKYVGFSRAFEYNSTEDINNEE
ncbi:13417_t:CDS:2 [Funneliformis caledonium]|uniref:DNA helicase n=1 Tax=Funneliformis caledonium TaxID=1117310 RepID=A0A9N9AY73_9GLOM|nr:13417_t:CDS:2 [Funneliformis caledonium]